MSLFTLTVTVTTGSSPQQLADDDNSDRLIHVSVIGGTGAYVGLGFTSTEVNAADKGFLLYGGNGIDGSSQRVSFVLPGGQELWVGPSVGSTVLVSVMVTEQP